MPSDVCPPHSKAQRLARLSNDEIDAFFLATSEGYWCECEYGHQRCSDEGGGACADELLNILAARPAREPL